MLHVRLGDGGQLEHAVGQLLAVLTGENGRQIHILLQRDQQTQGDKDGMSMQRRESCERSSRGCLAVC